MSENDGYVAKQVDYDLHGIVGIRLLDGKLDDVNAVSRQLGLLPAPLSRAPDIIIRFVDRIALSSSLHYIGVDDAGFTGDAFLVLRSKHKARARVQIPLAQVGCEQCQIICERGLPAVPLLIPILNLTALSKGSLPMHASAFRFRGVGVLTTGWSKGGKTETLLAFAANQAEYIGDEWVYISCDGQRMYGLPEPIRVWDWHLDSMPQWWSQIGRGERARLRALQLALRSMNWISANGRKPNTPARLVQRVRPLLKQQLCVDVAPQRLFDLGIGPLASNLDKVLFVVSQDVRDIVVRKVKAEEIAQRMVFSLQAERLEFMSYYLKFRFAFPDARNELIEQVEQRQRELLTKMMAGKDAYSVHHPYPVSLPALFNAIQPYL